jgi:hypothetical protein
MHQSFTGLGDQHKGAGQTVGVKRNIETRPCKHFSSGKSMSITYCECVYIASVIQHAMQMHHIVICGLPRSIIFFNIFS